MTVELTQINNNLRNQIELLEAKLAHYEELNSSELQDAIASGSRDRRKLEKRLKELTRLNKKLNSLVESSHERCRDLERQLAILRQENLELLNELRKFESRDRTLAVENDRIFTHNAKVLHELNST